MSTRTLPVTTASFEKVFAAIATKRTLRREPRPGQIAKLASSSRNAATWREIAWEALERKKLGDTLRRAVHCLTVECREVLFLQDVKNLSTAETAWVLDITVGAVRSRLLRARMKVRTALASGLQPKSSEKNSDFGDSCAHDISANLKIRERSRMGTVRITPLQSVWARDRNNLVVVARQNGTQETRLGLNPSAPVHLQFPRPLLPAKVPTHLDEYHQLTTPFGVLTISTTFDF